MRQNRIAPYTVFTAYPLLIAVMILVIADKASAAERALAVALAIAFALGSALLWTLLGRALHRLVPAGEERTI